MPKLRIYEKHSAVSFRLMTVSYYYCTANIIPIPWLLVDIVSAFLYSRSHLLAISPAVKAAQSSFFRMLIIDRQFGSDIVCCMPCLWLRAELSLLQSDSITVTYLPLTIKGRGSPVPFIVALTCVQFSTCTPLCADVAVYRYRK